MINTFLLFSWFYKAILSRNRGQESHEDGPQRRSAIRLPFVSIGIYYFANKSTFMHILALKCIFLGFQI